MLQLVGCWSSPTLSSFPDSVISANIRLLETTDIDAFREIRLLALSINPESFGASVEEESNFSEIDWRKRIGEGTSTDFLFGAFVDGSLVGVAGFFRQTRPKLQHKGMIWGVFVQPEYRGRGIARALVSQAVAHARLEPGLSVIQLCVAEPNTEAAQLYRSLGFVEFGIEPCARKIGDRLISEIHMWLPLFGES